MEKLKILVIGGGGYIGSMLISELIESRFYVRCFDRFSSSETLSKLKLNKKIEIIIGDIRNIESKKLFEFCELRWDQKFLNVEKSFLIKYF